MIEKLCGNCEFCDMKHTNLGEDEGYCRKGLPVAVKWQDGWYAVWPTVHITRDWCAEMEPK